MTQMVGVVAEIQTLRQQRDALQSGLDGLLDKASREGRGLHASEDRQFQRDVNDIRQLDARVSELDLRMKDHESRKSFAAEARRLTGVAGGVQSGSLFVNEPDMYQRGGGLSYFRDVFMALTKGNADARTRLQRNAQYETERRALGNTGAVGGSGGEWAPPGWVVDEWINVIRPGRVMANLFSHEPVPAGVSSLNYPKVNTGTAVALQTTQNTALAQQDMTTGFVQTGFATIGGKEVISQQLLDQSAINLDGVILKDLAAAYAAQIGTLVYTGTGNGVGTPSVLNGLMNATIGSTQTWTQANPTPQGFYGQCGALLSTFLGKRLLPPTCWVMNPRRWYWLESSTDNAGRPLVVPTGPAYNQIATQSGAPVAAGLVGTMHGVPVYIDPLLPITQGTGNNQDSVFLLKADDLVLLESDPQSEVFTQPYADSLGVLYRLYCYAGTVLNRHPESIGVLQGTGLTPPAFQS